jgi:CDP-6-deoxy-D-xylo-4-hexulose-3-dehydrase
MINELDKTYLLSLIKKSETPNKINKSYPLLQKGFTEEDIYQGIKILLSRKLTMGDVTKKFEKKFSKYIGSEFSLMVNSGSSANLLIAFLLINLKKKNRLKIGDKFLIPSLCWSTSLWPFVQAGLKPEFIDVDKKNFCLDLNLLDSKKIKGIKLIVNINVLGNCPNLQKLSNFCKNKDIYFVEDNCESLGTKFKNKFTGTFSDFASFSFYYSHQLTTGEGGMITCKKYEDFKLLKVLRAHGWDRDIVKNSTNKFNFINQGFNLRPMDITAAIGISQLSRLNKMKILRNKNRDSILDAIKNHKKWNNQFTFFECEKEVSPSWFGLPLLISKEFLKKKKKFIDFLASKKIETRPIISGNFLNQPALKLYKFKSVNLINTDEIDKSGFFIGLQLKQMSSFEIKFLANCLLEIDRL